jgi:hypothetical protein
MNKFNTQLHIEETNDYKAGELMNELNNQQFTSMAHKRRVERLQNDNIQVNDKVQWTALVGDEDIVIKGRVLSISQFNGEKNFVVRVLGKEDTQTTLHHSRVTKV